MEIRDLINKIDKVGNINKEVVIRAYNLACKAHEGQMRLSGEPYVVHPIEVAGILVEIGMDTNTIAAALLHDVVEDSDYTYEDIEGEFGQEIAQLVEGVTKLGKIEYKSKEEEQADNVRKMVLAMAKDIRVVLIKLADRLHNMRTLRFKSPEKQKEKAKEVFDIYAPLAHRLGMFRIKWELEDLAFRYINPTEYYDLVDQIAEKRVERESYIKKIIFQINEELLKVGIKAEIDGRPKHFYSIYKKMNNKSKTLDQIFDLTAVRIILDELKDCYSTLGIVHTIYKPIPGRFKDYIAMPKPNMYQSLHTTVIGPLGKPFEIQIRTQEMHKIAEYGIAAHWNYKENNRDESMDSKLKWLRDMLEWQKETSDADEFMEGFKIDLFEDEVFVFTPKGEVINLPSNACPIDFAYRIHTDIGNKMIGAKVNGNIVPLDYKLKTGEIVEIITSNSNKGPNIHWLNIAQSNQAKAKIRSWFKKEKREENIQKGKELLEKEAKKQDRNFADIAKGVALHKIIQKYHGNSIEDLYVVVGAGQVNQSFVVSYLKNEADEKEKIETNKSLEESVATANELIKNSQKLIKNKAKGKAKNYFGVTVTGMDNVEVRFAKCCNPVPGDQIEGYITNFRGISVHRKDCPNYKILQNTEEASRFVDVAWESSPDEVYSSKIRVIGIDRPNLLTDIMFVMSELKVAISMVTAEKREDGTSNINMNLLVSNTSLLNEVIKRIKRMDSVTDVYRTSNS